MSRFVADITNEIIKNLKDHRYSNVQQVLKELIQNADDAAGSTEAPRLVFGCHPGFGDEIDHPLLNGPALWFFNNCDFDVSDKRNIRSFGINSKAGDSSKIGKFGLGMKSVFHLTEAFLYVVLHDGNPFTQDMLNPWDDDEKDHPHADWSRNLEVAWAQLQDFARQQMMPDEPSSFLLWLPLRSKKLLSGARPLIDYQPGNAESEELEFLAASDLPETLAALLAMLPHLERITYQHPTHGFDIRYRPHNSLDRLRLLGSLNSSNEKFAGQVVGATSPLDISALHISRGDDAAFLAMRNDDAWPRNFHRDPKTEMKSYEADKSNAEGAVVIAHGGSDKEGLTIAWAVVLPLEQHSKFEAMHGTGKHWRITLHGQFFVDAGRQGIAGFADNFRHADSLDSDLSSLRLQHRWNKSIASELVLPSILPAVAQHATLYRISDDHITQLSKALNLWIKGTSWRRQICADYTWARVIQPEGSAWRLLQAGAPSDKLRTLPLPPASDPKRPWDVFAGLDALGAVFVQNDEKVSPISQVSTLWSEDDIVYLLRCLDLTSIAAKSAHLDYLIEALNLFKPSEKPRAQCALLNSLRNAFPLLGLKGIRKNGKKISETCAHLGEKLCFPLGAKSISANSTLPDAIFKALWQVDADLLLLPGDLMLQTGQPPHLSESLLERWLACLQPLLDDHDLGQHALAASRELLEGLENKKDRALFVRKHPELRIIAARRSQNKSNKALCLREINCYKDKKSLFSIGSATDKYELLAMLGRVLPEQELFLITPTDQEFAFSKPSLPKADSDAAALECIAHYRGQLGSRDDRKKLVAKLNFSTQFPPEARYGMRFLLHGDATHWNSDEVLWKADGRLGTAWAILWEDLRQFREISTWQILDPEIAAELRINDDGMKTLKIKSVARAELIGQLAALDLRKLEGKRYGRLEREEILSGIQEDKLWRNLPFHEYEDGRIQHISQDSVRSGALPIPKDLRDLFPIIRLAEHEELRKRQEKEVPELNHQRLAAAILNKSSPHNYTTRLLDALESLDEKTTYRESPWRNTAWLKLENGTVIAPSNLLRIDGLDDELRTLAAKVGYQFAPLTLLPQSARNHRQYQRLCTCLALSPEESYQKLPQFLQEVPGYGIGYPVKALQLAEAMPALTKVDELPAWHLLAEAAKSVGKPPESAQFQDLKQELNPDTLVAVCNRLAEMEGDPAKLAHAIYLQQFASHAETGTIHLKQLRLRAQTGDLADASNLCHKGANVEQASLLDIKQAQILSPKLKLASNNAQNSSDSLHEQPNIETLAQSANGVLREVFRKWETRVRPALIGVFLCTLGKAARELANYYLKGSPYNFDAIHQKLGIAGQVNDYPLVIQPVIDKIELVNLVDEKKSFPLSIEVNSLIVGTPKSTYFHHLQRVYFVLAFRNIDTAKFNDEGLNKLLLRSVQEVLEKKYPALDALWQELANSEQLEVAITRQVILDRLPERLKDLGLNGDSIFRSKLDQIQDAQRERAKIKVAEASGPSDAKRNKQRIDIEKAIEGYRKGLAKFLEDNRDAQKAVLKAVCGKIEGFHYSPESILFELFQNADDAAVELARCETDDELEVPEPAQRLIIQIEPGFIRLAHFGRRINWASPTLQANRPGYADDLEKMLSLLGSDKELQNEEVTGHFGLGFKSVFLACETPRLLSDSICTEIRAGILPCTWDSAQNANNLLQCNTKDRNYPGTVIELPVADAMASRLLVRFRSLASMLVVFSRAIRRITFEDKGKISGIAWSPTNIMPGIEVGSIGLDGLANSGKLLVIRTPRGSVAMSLGANGPLAFDVKKIALPSIWVTAPTAENEHLGYALNGMFSIDAGRGGLARQIDKNISLAGSIGQAMGTVLAKFFLQQKKTDAWEAHRLALGLAGDCSCAQFWADLWKTLCKYPLQESSGAHVASLARKLVLSAFNTWVDLVHVVPSGLAGKYAQFVEFEQSVREVQQNWNVPTILSAIQEIPSLKGSKAALPLVSKTMADLLRQSERQKRVSPFDISTLLQMAAPDSHCSPAHASSIEALITAIEQEISAAFDGKPLADLKLKFQNEAQDWVPTQYILCMNEKNGEEALRYELAPPNNRLHSSYRDTALTFFLRSRGEFKADAESLTGWLLCCVGRGPQTAALRYLAEGTLASEVAKKLRPSVKSCWLSDVNERHPSMQDLDEASRVEVLRHLIPDAEIQASVNNWQSSKYSQGTHPRKTGKAALQAINTWWKSEGRCLYRQRYLENLYPQNQMDASGCLKGLSLDGGVNRRAWMTLFSIAVFQRLGRVRDFQTRGFVEVMDEKGWWATLCECPPKDNGDAWIGVLRDFAEQQTESEKYDYWLDSFPRLFKLANWLEAYVDIFEGINSRQKNQLNSMLLLSPNTDTVYQGTGFTAPPLVKTLKKGVHLVVRELLRAGVVKTPEAHRLAFMPAKRVLRVLDEIECRLPQENSESIWLILSEGIGPKEAIFGGDFDIPLLILAEQRDVLRDVLQIDLSDEDDGLEILE
jgi:hypothetical protein